MTHSVGPKGQVVIPKAMRDALGLAPGDQVDFELGERAVLVRPARPQGSAGASLRRAGLVEQLEREHRRERER